MTQRVSALSDFLLKRPPLLLQVAPQLGRGVVFESAIRGSSMWPAIASLARLRVQILAGRPCRIGDIVYCLADDSYVVHRVDFVLRPGRSRSVVLTCGDNCLAPDPPLPLDCILGTVISVQTETGWCTPPPRRAPSIWHRWAQGVCLAATIVALRGSPSAWERISRFSRAAQGVMSRATRRRSS